MHLVRIGTRVINLDFVAHIEIHDDGLTLYYAATQDVHGKPVQLRLFNPEAIGLLGRLEKLYNVPTNSTHPLKK